MEGEAEKWQKEEEPLRENTGCYEQPGLQVCLGTRCLKDRGLTHFYSPSAGSQGGYL